MDKIEVVNKIKELTSELENSKGAAAAAGSGKSKASAESSFAGA